MQALNNESWNTLSKFQQINLINASNSELDIFKNNWVQSEDQLAELSIPHYGIPILVAADPEILKFKQSDIFSVDDRNLCSKVYGHDNVDYVGFKHSFHSNKFLSNFEVRDSFKEAYHKIIDYNLQSITQINKLKKKFEKIGAFQTRNIPHKGHERILELMLDHCEHLVINPVIGPKKTGDITLNALKKAYEFVAKERYDNRISFIPIIANMFYAGPNEALHHSWIRERLGFNLFSVGRDHAGAANAYSASAAIELVRKHKSKFEITLLCHSGAFYCHDCNQIVVKDFLKQYNTCEHSILSDISGSNFRKSLESNMKFDLADEELQNFLNNIEDEVFEL